MIYYCEKCGVWFPEDDLMEIMPDVGVFHADCNNPDFEEYSEREIIKLLNEKEIR
jgi:hypothetical protein